MCHHVLTINRRLQQASEETEEKRAASDHGEAARVPKDEEGCVGNSSGACRRAGAVLGQRGRSRRGGVCDSLSCGGIWGKAGALAYGGVDFPWVVVVIVDSIVTKADFYVSCSGTVLGSIIYFVYFCACFCLDALRRWWWWSSSLGDGDSDGDAGGGSPLFCSF